MRERTERKMEDICEPLSVKHIGSGDAGRLKQMNERLPDSNMKSAVRQFALLRSRWKNAAITNNCMKVKSMPCATAYQQLPIRCVKREIGAMKVCSIVPSQRSIVMISVTPSKVTLR